MSLSASDARLRARTGQAAARWNLATVDAAEEAARDEIIDLNLMAAFFIAKYALLAPRAAKGNIVNIASICGLSAEAADPFSILDRICQAT